MGYGEYSHAAHVALTATRTPATVRFQRDACHPLMRPHGARREARDSEEHPESLGVVFAFDVSGSMGAIPRELATRTLPAFMAALLDARVRDPQVCFMAVGHAGHDDAPLQVGQFESSAALIDQWLTRIHLEGRGVGDHECYELAMYFAARRMELDSVRERGRRGYLFITGDVAPNPAVSRAQVAKLIGDELDADIPLPRLIEELQQRFEPFFLLAPGARRELERPWRDVLGDRVVRLEEVADTAWVAAGLVALLEGAVGSLDGWVRRLEAAGLGRRDRSRVAKVLVPFAASLGRDGAPKSPPGRLGLPVGDLPSGMAR